MGEPRPPSCAAAVQTANSRYHRWTPAVPGTRPSQTRFRQAHKHSTRTALTVGMPHTPTSIAWALTSPPLLPLKAPGHRSRRTRRTGRATFPGLPPPPPAANPIHRSTTCPRTAERESHSKSQRRQIQDHSQPRRATIWAAQLPGEPSWATLRDARKVTGGQGVAGSNPTVPTKRRRSKRFRTSGPGPLSIFGSHYGSHPPSADPGAFRKILSMATAPLVSADQARQLICTPRPASSRGACSSVARTGGPGWPNGSRPGRPRPPGCGPARHETSATHHHAASAAASATICGRSSTSSRRSPGSTM
jgi:hypothetical protein